MTLTISIGILAHNEKDCIASTLESFLAQSLFTNLKSDINIELIVVPNGCSDNTAEISRQTLKELIQPSWSAHITWKVCEIEQPGLANAWNRFIHDFSSPEADYMVVAAADIQFYESKTLASMVDLLEKSPEVLVAVDKKIKDISLREAKTFKDYFSMAISKISGAKEVTPGKAAWISGQLSCTRSSVLRRIWMPTTLPTDDAFLYTMIVTEGLKHQSDPCRVVLAPSAAHIFEAYTDLSKLFRHEKWLIFGQTVNKLLYADLANKTEEVDHVCELIKQRNDIDPLWLNKLVKDYCHHQTWLIPRFILVRRFQSLIYKPLHKAIMLFPLALATFLVDVYLAIQVQWELKQSGNFNNWTTSGGWGK